jgi:hypothetical protein
MKGKNHFLMNRKKPMGLFFGLLSLTAVCFLIGCVNESATEFVNTNVLDGEWTNQNQNGPRVLSITGSNFSYNNADRIGTFLVDNAQNPTRIQWTYAGKVVEQGCALSDNTLTLEDAGNDGLRPGAFIKNE